MKISLKIQTSHNTTRGALNLDPRKQKVFNKMKSTCQKTFQQFGFMPIETAPFIKRRHLVKNQGEVNKQIYGLTRINSNAKAQIGLPFDRTLPLAIWAAENFHKLTFPFSRSDVSYSFRAERKQRGRFNAFLQADIDTLGKNLTYSADAEVLTTCNTTLKRLFIPKFTHRINHISIPKSMIRSLGIKNERKALQVLDKYEKVSDDKTIQELIKLTPKKSHDHIHKLVEICRYKGSVEQFAYSEFLDQKGVEALKMVQSLFSRLLSNGLSSEEICFSPGTIRGLEYYTGSVFETFLNEHEEYGSIASGGRYDGLLDMFSKKKTEVNGVGMSIGLTRLFDVLSYIDLLPSTQATSAKVAVIYRNTSLQCLASKAAIAVRNHNIDTVLYTGSANTLSKQLSWCNKIEIPYAFMIVDDNSFVIKNLTNSSQSEDISGLDLASRTLAEVVRKIDC